MGEGGILLAMFTSPRRAFKGHTSQCLYLWWYIFNNYNYCLPLFPIAATHSVVHAAPSAVQATQKRPLVSPATALPAFTGLATPLSNVVTARHGR